MSQQEYVWIHKSERLSKTLQICYLQKQHVMEIDVLQLVIVMERSGGNHLKSSYLKIHV